MTQREDIAGAVARGWCHPDNAYKVMDEKLAVAIIDEVVKLHATQSAQIPGWRDIESAPKDGTVILGYRDGRIGTASKVPRDTEALRKELERIGAQNAKLYDDFNKSQLELERVKGERDAMKLDAERYRYIRDTDNGEVGSLFIGVDSSQYPSRWALSEDEADKAIDAAIAAQGGKV